MNKRFLTLLAIFVLLSQFFIASRVNAAVTTDFLSQSLTIGLDQCKSPEELDCIEGVWITDAKGRFVQLQYSNFSPINSFTDFLGNEMRLGIAQYSNPGFQLPLRVELDSPKHRLWQLPDGNYATGSAMRIFASLPASDFVTKVRVQVRTSFLVPQDIQLHAADPTYSFSPITGGTLWTFTGSQVVMSGYNWNPSMGDFFDKYRSLEPADWSFPTLNFFVHHYTPEPGTTFFDNRCNGNGNYTVEGHNAPGAGVPLWDPETQTLNFNIYAAHLRQDGSLNQGFFMMEMFDDYIKCAWPGAIDLVNAGTFTVSVLEEDGTVQPAVTSVTHQNGVLKVSVTDFHYSIPTIQVKGFPCPIQVVLQKARKCPIPSNVGVKGKPAFSNGIYLNHNFATSDFRTKFSGMNRGRAATFTKR